MDVGVQEAVRETRPAKTSDAPLEIADQASAVTIVAYESFACVSLGDDMMDGTRRFFSWPTRH
jgi:hypothetical protein